MRSNVRVDLSRSHKAQQDETSASETAIRARNKRIGNRFFWGVLVMLLVATLALTLIGIERGSDPESLAAPDADRVEIPRTRLEKLLSEASEEALESVVPDVESLLDLAYEPVYAAIPVYADFHYSVLGVYIELGDAAFGNLSGGIQEKLFDGLEERLQTVAWNLDTKFDAAYREALEDRIESEVQSEGKDLQLGDATEFVRDDVLSRLKVSAPVASIAATAIGSGTLKVVATPIAKKLAAKLAAKVAAKGTAKVGGVLTGAGTGAAVCWWSGPGAVACGVAGGVITWFAVDAAVVNIDEYFNREEFESDLRKLIDEDKAAKQEALEVALTAKAGEMDHAAERTMADFTLRELASDDLAEACALARSVVSNYDAIRDDFRARTPDAVATLRGQIAELRKFEGLKPLAEDLDPVLAGPASEIKLVRVSATGNFPEEFRANRDASGVLLAGDNEISLARSDATESDGFALASMSNLILGTGAPVEMKLTLEQHLRIRRNRIFDGELVVEWNAVFASITGESGKESTFPVEISIAGAGDADDVDAAPPSGEPVILHLTMTAGNLPVLDSARSCLGVGQTPVPE